jgi:hypothetical protein
MAMRLSGYVNENVAFSEKNQRKSIEFETDLVVSYVLSTVFPKAISDMGYNLFCNAGR